MLNLHELSVFLAAAKYGSFSEAGRQLHLSQPAISQTIDSLEKRFSTRLFFRQGRCVKLTEAGQVLKPLASELLTSARRVDETMSSLQGEVVGEMVIGCSTASGKYLLPGLIARFKREFQHVRIHVNVTNRDGVIHKMLSGEFSLGVSSKIIEHSDLEYQSFFRDDIILIAPSEHPWVNFRKVYPDDLLDEPLILREEGAGTREEMTIGLRKQDILPDMLNIAMVLGNAEAIVMAVEEGIGVAFVSRLAASRSIDLGRVVEIEVLGMPLQRSILMARNRRFTPTRSQTEFWDYVSSQAAEILKCSQPLSS
jgi:LysR family transcriptional regulator, transcriptional activator of the cysJI operon